MPPIIPYIFSTFKKIVSSSRFIDILLPFILGIISIISALAISKGYDLLGFDLFVRGFAVIICFIAINALLVGFLTRSVVFLSIKEEIATIRRLITSFHAENGNFSWLWPNSELDQLEGGIVGSEIWIVSPNLRNDTGGAPLIPIIKANAARGITYTYIVPIDDINIRGRIEELRSIFQDNPKKCVIIGVPTNDFDLLPSTHIAIYNPKAEGETPPEVFLEIPIEGRGWWIKMSGQDAYAFVGKIKNLKERYTNNIM
jgi:hypothetical protein